MNNRRANQAAASKKRRRERSINQKEEARVMQVARIRRNLAGNFIRHHAQGGGRSNFGANPIFYPKRTKFKGWMRN